jgi:alkylated DNA repair dioxygenase AlkB
MEQIKLKYGNGFLKIGKLDFQLTDKQITELWSLKPTERSTYRIFNNIGKTPRFHKNFGVKYNFSNMNVEFSEEIPEILGIFLKYVNNIEKKQSEEGFEEYNGILVNWYPEGKDYIGYHSDDEKGLNGNIWTISLGGTRKFKLQSKNRTDKDDYSFDVKNGDIIVMCESDTQKFYKHSITKTKKKVEPRISITIRRFK